MRRAVHIKAAATALAGAAAFCLLKPAPAVASTAYGCDWPKVCFYLTGDDWSRRAPTAGYEDITRHFQELGPRSKGADWVFNSRNDDRALIRYTFGGRTGEVCLGPNKSLSLGAHTTVTHIKIEDSRAC
ncbi:hypothetical protein [Streptomyces sp. BA2]|uniref:hypothetical protein n=1 Tax=Streptomyces sp. BA2 TaxID=436595 RepID=UPI001327D08C|nr:hypothetical protein [Streptomyces sp. BA2]MWA15989.1 hypothetical protein [Streptomyces sp. BA2]